MKQKKMLRNLTICISSLYLQINLNKYSTKKLEQTVIALKFI